MADDLEILKELSMMLIGRHPNDFFIRTDLHCIIPKGQAGYSLNEQNKITGLKVGGLEKKVAAKMLSIIPKLECLERLVIYFDYPADIPKEICSLKHLNYLCFNNVARLPKEVFAKKITFGSKGSDFNFAFSGNSDKIIERIALFKDFNPILRNIEVLTDFSISKKSQ
ncbi:MAG TPA: hypothetical protein VNW06_13210 [Cytophagaceae bacterium]|jgi:hypothetical protein|nr:hypothetical protein [Cytophagaceae bacterium]